MELLENDKNIIKNVLNNLIDYTKLKYIVLYTKNSKISKESIKLMEELEAVHNFSSRNIDFYIKIKKPENSSDNEVYFQYIIVENINKSSNNIKNIIDDLKKKNNKHITLFTSKIFVQSDLDILKNNIKLEHILSYESMCINIRNFIKNFEIEPLFYDEYDTYLKTILVQNNFNINKDSCDLNLFIKLYYNNLPIYGLKYKYINNVTGPQTEIRFYKNK